MNNQMISKYNLLIICLIAFGCGSKTEGTQTSDSSESSGIFAMFNEESSWEPEFETVKDPNESAFTVNMPKGWKTKVGLERVSGQIRECGFTISPDGKTRMFFGDPSIPAYSLPMPQLGMYEGVNSGNPMSQVRSYVPAGNFAKEYAGLVYSKMEGFGYVSSEEDPELKREFEQAALKVGVQSKVTAARVKFKFRENGEDMVGAIRCVTSEAGYSWIVNISGYTTTPAKEEQTKALFAGMTSSYRTEPAWREQENRAFANRMENDRYESNQRMNQMTAAHQQRMNNMQSNFQSHQQRMSNMQSSFDNYNQAYNQRMAQQDRNVDQFIDVINERQQIKNGDQTGKVESGYNQYYVNQSTGQYFGTNSAPEQIPEGYEEWQIDNRDY